MFSVSSALTSFTCCNAKLVTNVPSLLCLHVAYIVTKVDIIDIMANTNLNILTT